MLSLLSEIILLLFLTRNLIPLNRYIIRLILLKFSKLFQSSLLPAYNLTKVNPISNCLRLESNVSSYFDFSTLFSHTFSNIKHLKRPDNLSFQLFVCLTSMQSA